MCSQKATSVLRSAIGQAGTSCRLGRPQGTGVKTVFSADEVHPRDRFDYWHSVVCRAIVAHDSTPTCRPTFRAQLRSGALAEIGMIQLDTGAFHFSRGGRHAESDDLLICRLHAGTMMLEQC